VSLDKIDTDSTTTTTASNETSLLARSLRDFVDELEESSSVLVRAYGGYFGGRAVFHGLGGLRCPLLDSVACQNVNDADEIDLSVPTFCTTTAFTSYTSPSS